MDHDLIEWKKCDLFLGGDCDMKDNSSSTNYRKYVNVIVQEGKKNM